MITPEQMERVQYQFEAFCKLVLKNKARTLHKQFDRQEGREIALSTLPPEAVPEPGYEDEYHFTDPVRFSKQDWQVQIDNPVLRDALASLLPKYREVILLSYFMGYSDAEIAKQLGLQAKTVSSRRKNALSKLKERIGSTGDF